LYRSSDRVNAKNDFKNIFFLPSHPPLLVVGPHKKSFFAYSKVGRKAFLDEKKGVMGYWYLGGGSALHTKSQNMQKFQYSIFVKNYFGSTERQT